jgi:hypothetical protein
MFWLVSRSKSRTVYKPLPLGMGFMTVSNFGFCKQSVAALTSFQPSMIFGRLGCWVRGECCSYDYRSVCTTTIPQLGISPLFNSPSLESVKLLNFILMTLIHLCSTLKYVGNDKALKLKSSSDDS